MKKLFIPLFFFLLLYDTPFAQTLAERDYAELLTKSLQFFNGQACGPNVDAYSSFGWRGACHTDDDPFEGGWHDAGDHVKFNYPMGQSVYNLASLYVDHRQEIDATGNKSALLKHLRFIGDYMMRCHPEPNQYVIQVAEGTVDHQYWQVPEEQVPGGENNYERTVFMADKENPNTNLACVNAAAFAALSMALQETGVEGDEALSEELLQHARDLYKFGYENQASYNKSSTVDGGPLPGNPYLDRPTGEFAFYKDNNDFQDEIMVGAAWLYRATGDGDYLEQAEAAFSTLGNYLGGWVHNWGDNQYEAAFQLAQITGEAVYLDALDRYVSAIADGEEGLVLDESNQAKLWVPNGGGGFSLPLSLGGALVAYRYAELVGSDDPIYDKAREFAFSQVNYALGDNSFGRSFVVGYGTNPPRVTHHRAAHSPFDGGSRTAPIDTDPEEDTHILTGALVMGPRIQPEGTANPGEFDYTNRRSVISETEVALGNNAILATVAALMVKETGATAEPVAQSSYNNDGASWSITNGTTLQAEDYDEGGQSVAYYDNTPDSNAGGEYRNEGVDIGATQAGTTYVGWTEAGEWLEYSVDVTEGTYDIQVSMASPEDDRQLRILLGNETLNEVGTATLTDNTETFEDFRTVTLSEVSLAGGEQTLRLEMVNGSFNIDAISFVDAATDEEPNNPPTPGSALTLGLFPQDENGWTLLDPERAEKIIYVSASTGDDNTGITYPFPSTEIGEDPLQPSGTIQPFRTVAAAANSVSNGEAAWILLKRGDTFYESLVKKQGKNDEQPLVYSYYGTEGAPPLLKTGSQTGINVCCRDFANFWMVGLSFYAHTRNPDDPDYVGPEGGRGFRFYADSSYTVKNILIEGCSFRFYRNNVMEEFKKDFGEIANVAIRRNGIFDNYSSTSRSQGMYIFKAEGVVLEENTFDHNGWYRQSTDPEGRTKANGQATLHNHNTYFANTREVRFEGNAFFRPSSIGTKWTANEGENSTSDIEIINNFYHDCEVGISAWGNKKKELPYRFKNMTVQDNVISRPGLSNLTNRTLGWGIRTNDWDNSQILNNFIIHQNSEEVTNGQGIILRGQNRDVTIRGNVLYDLQNTRGFQVESIQQENVTITENILDFEPTDQPLVRIFEALSTYPFDNNTYVADDLGELSFRIGGDRIGLEEWQQTTGETNVSTTRPNYPNPERSVERYVTEVLGLPDMATFYAELRNQTRLNWREEYTGQAINAWIKQGFDLDTTTPPTPDEEGTIVVRAKGDCGSETFELRIDDQTVLTETVTTSYADYTYSGYTSGEVSVHFINNQTEGCDRNLSVDYIDVCGTRIQSESEEVVQSANWTNGDKQVLFTDGNNHYGNPGCGNPGGTVLIRAKSSQGSERMSLVVDQDTLQTWTVATAPDNYTYQGYTGGVIQVSFDNDSGEGAPDRNLAVNYIRVCGTKYESNGQGVVRNACGTDNDRGFAWLYCSGSFTFGDVGCNPAARTTAELAKPSQPKLMQTEAFNTYPNPAHSQLTVQGGKHYQATLYSMSGRVVMHRAHLRGKARLEITHLRPGLYILKLSDGQHQLRQRVVIE